MNNNAFETLIGAVVVALAGVFLFYAYSVTDSVPSRGYTLFAEFDSVDGLASGSDVRLSGIKIGTVAAQTLNTETFLARVELAMDADVKLPDDSSIKVTADGLLGGSYLSIEPGGSEENLENGGEIRFTQGSIDLIGLVGQAIFSTSGSGSDSSQ